MVGYAHDHTNVASLSQTEKKGMLPEAMEDMIFADECSVQLDHHRRTTMFLQATRI